MKKLVSLMLACVMLISFISCTSEDPESGTDTAAQTTTEDNTAVFTTEPVADIDRTWPCVSGTFVQPDPFIKYSVADWEKHFAYLKEVGMDIFIIQWTSITPNGKVTGIYYPSELMKKPSEDAILFLPNVLEAAQNSGIKVFVGLNLSDEWWNKGCSDTAWNEKEAALGVQMAGEIHSLYKEKYPDALYGWYFAYEMYNGMSGLEENGGDFLNGYINGLDALDNSMPIMLSPFITTSGSTPVKAGKQWKKVFENADFRDGDIFCCQDAVGAGHITIDRLDEYFRYLKDAVDTEPGLLFWANSEDFTKDGEDYSSADMGRFTRQLKIAEPYVSGYVTFAYSHYYSPDYNGKGGYHRAYKYYFNTGKTETELGMPELSVVEDKGKTKVKAVVKNTDAGIMKIEFKAPGDVPLVYEVPAWQLSQEEFAPMYSINQVEGQSEAIVKVKVTDYFGNVVNDEITVKF